MAKEKINQSIHQSINFHKDMVQDMVTTVKIGVFNKDLKILTQCATLIWKIV